MRVVSDVDFRLCVRAANETRLYIVSRIYLERFVLCLHAVAIVCCVRDAMVRECRDARSGFN